MSARAAANIHVLSGCSGGGKSTLLDALSTSGFQVVPEAGRQVVRDETETGGSALPWVNVDAFIVRAFALSLDAFVAHETAGAPVIADRSMVDLVSHLEHMGQPVPSDMEDAVRRCRYAGRVFLTPPWAEIYVDDGERNKTFETAVAEYESLVSTYLRLGYEPCIVPRDTVVRRADFVAARIGIFPASR